MAGCAEATRRVPAARRPMLDPTTLLAVPNVSEARDDAVVDALAGACARPPVRLLDVHRDSDHNRSVLSLAGPPGSLHEAVVSLARAAVERIDLRRHDGVHPFIGALDVAPIVHLDAGQRGAACAEALVLGDRLARELELPVFLYDLLAGGRTRAEIRRGGPAELARRIAGGELTPDFGPRRLHPTAGAVLVGARPPLVAFNLELAAGVEVELARRIAALIRAGGAEGLPGLRAIGLPLASRGVVQISLNVEDPIRVPLAAIVAAVRRHAAVAAAEIVALVPRAALAGFPADVPIRGFEPARQVIEEVLAGADAGGAR